MPEPTTTTDQLPTAPALPRARYQEDDWIAEVEILEDQSSETTEAYELRVVRTIQVSRLYKPTPDGRVLRCWQRRGYPCFTLTRQEDARD